nr:unnamed protein product [Callosobruchus chinensis]
MRKTALCALFENSSGRKCAPKSAKTTSRNYSSYDGWKVTRIFHKKVAECTKQKSVFTQQTSVPSNALLSSFKVAYRVAKCKKPHTIAEELILPAAVDMVNIMLGESAGKTFQRYLYLTTLLAEDLNDQLIEKIKGKEFGLQLDEATDSNKDAHLINLLCTLPG